MSDIVSTLRERVLLADGATGSYLFERTGRLSTENHTYEALNVENPDLIRRYPPQLPSGRCALPYDEYLRSES